MTHATRRPGLFPRDEILERTDLRALADEILGPHRGHGTAACWPCPTHQPQTGRTPPVTIFLTRSGEEWWRCHACGTGGTAIDLLIQARGCSVRGALEQLADRAHLTTTHATHAQRPRPRIATPTVRVEPSPAVAAHARRCAELLWTPTGNPVRTWLRARGFTDTTLHHHLIGADPGPRALDRPAGLPRGGVAAIFPVVHDGELVYFQGRYLDPAAAHDRRYDNPTAALAPNPRLAHYAPATSPASPVVYVCEGIPDALSVTQAGHRAVAVLGVGLARQQIAEQLAINYRDAPLRIAFDTDPRGTLGAELLLDELHDLDHPDPDVITLPPGVRDLNDWLRTAPTSFATTLDAHTPPPLAVASEGVGADLGY